MIERLLAAERALAEGQLDQAERLFVQVAGADERNAMAVVGLAEVAVARGDRTAAAALAVRALTIDPDDAAAARLLASTAAPLLAAPSLATPSLGSPSIAARLGAWLRRLLGREG
jgi:uncharacterized protein HemY